MLGLVAIAAGCSGGGGGGGGIGCPAPVVAATNVRSIVFQGGHVEIDASTLTAYEDATLAAWVRLDEDSNDEDLQIAGKGRPGDAPAFALYADAGQRIAAGFDDGSGTFETAAAFTGAIPLSTWTHVAVAWSTSSLAFYVNGSVVVNTTTLTGPTTASDAPIFIGGGLDEGDAGLPWTGAIDEVRLWAGAHEAGQIQATYEEMLTGAELELLAAWNFEEAGKNVADLTPGCHAGRTHGAVTRTADAPF